MYNIPKDEKFTSQTFDFDSTLLILVAHETRIAQTSNANMAIVFTYRPSASFGRRPALRLAARCVSVIVKIRSVLRSDAPDTKLLTSYCLRFCMCCWLKRAYRSLLFWRAWRARDARVLFRRTNCQIQKTRQSHDAYLPLPPPGVTASQVVLFWLARLHICLICDLLHDGIVMPWRATRSSRRVFLNSRRRISRENKCRECREQRGSNPSSIARAVNIKTME